jgi:hypothetical protein
VVEYGQEKSKTLEGMENPTGKAQHGVELIVELQVSRTRRLRRLLHNLLRTRHSACRNEAKISCEHSVGPAVVSIVVRAKEKHHAGASG